MSETPSHEPSSAAEDATETVAEPATTPAAAPAAPAEPAATTPSSHAAGPSKFAKWGTVAALVLAVLAIAGAAYGYFYPNQTAAAAGKYSDQQRNDAKKHICETFKIVDRAVVRNSHLKNPENGGPIGALSVATAQRFAFYDGGAFLRDRVAAELEVAAQHVERQRHEGVAQVADIVGRDTADIHRHRLARRDLDQTAGTGVIELHAGSPLCSPKCITSVA